MAESPGAHVLHEKAHVPDQARRVLDAGARCFARKGFKSTTIDEIALEAGLSRPILYKYHRGKEALIDAVLNDLLGQWESQMEDPEGFEFAADALRSKIVRTVGFASERPLLQSILQQDPRVLMSGHMEIFNRVNDANLAHAERIVRLGQKNGEFAADLEAGLVAEMIELASLALCERALGIRHHAGGKRAAVDAKLVDEFATVLIRGLQA